MDLNPANWVRDGWQFVQEARGEYKKVTWPTQQEYVGGTIGVVVIVAIITLVLGVVDFGLANALKQLVP